MRKVKNAVFTSFEAKIAPSVTIERDDHAGGPDGDDGGRVARPDAEERQALASDLMADPVADVRDAARERRDEQDESDPGERVSHTAAALRSRLAPIAVKMMFGIHAHRNAIHTSASPTYEKTVAAT